MAETQKSAEQAFDLFVTTFTAKFPATTTCLAKDRGVLLTFYTFPAEHWMHIRTTNPIESTFATVAPFSCRANRGGHAIGPPTEYNTPPEGRGGKPRIIAAVCSATDPMTQHRESTEPEHTDETTSHIRRNCSVCLLTASLGFPG